MGDVIRIDDAFREIDDAIQQRKREQHTRMAENLRALATRAEKGELLGVAFVALPSDREAVSVGVLKTEQTGLHELVGATTILNDYLRKAILG